MYLHAAAQAAGLSTAAGLNNITINNDYAVEVHLLCAARRVAK